MKIWADTDIDISIINGIIDSILKVDFLTSK